jgi:hypothetical protein
MGLFEQAQRDYHNITTNLNGSGQAFVIKTPKSDITANLIGLSTKHHINYDTEGVMVNSKNASVTFTEKQLTDVNYPVRNSGQEVDILGHLIEVADSSGVVKKYIINEQYPDEFLGSIVCILEDYE